MTVTVKRIGNDLAVVLPEDVARRLNAAEGATLSLTEADGRVSIERARPGVRAEVMAAYMTSHERFAELYKKLAE